MALPNDLENLDYVYQGGPFADVAVDGTVGNGSMDTVYQGGPYMASATSGGSTDNALLTQNVVEVLRDGDDPGGGNLRVTQVIKEVLLGNSENIYLTANIVEVLRRQQAQSAKGSSWMVFDEVNHLDVLIQYGTAPTSAANELAVLNGANMALWGDELLQFRDVTSLGSGVYRLSHLLRGRFGTEWAMNSHTLGDKFILLSTTTAKRVSMAQSDIGVNKLYRGVTIGMPIQSALTRGLTNNAAGLKPYAPCFVTGSRDGGNNLTITWVRRSRYGAEWMDLVDVPIGEDSEAYEVDILDSSGTVVRTLDGLTTASASYTAAQQTTDFGSPQALISIVVYQISAIVGRGYGTRISV